MPTRAIPARPTAPPQARARGIAPVIPHKANEKNKPAFSATTLYKARGRVEQGFGRLKRFKHVAPRCRKGAAAASDGADRPTKAQGCSALLLLLSPPDLLLDAGYGDDHCRRTHASGSCE
ncbi:hypothetical protein K663_09130 [Sphingobium sp. MI1205]|nr:hypothetical protein K663_09130 [Sphingobium sp. MI1205]